MRAFITAVSTVSRVLGFLAGLLLASAVLSICEMVFVRYVLGQSTVWQTEYTTYAIVAATFLGAPWVLLVRGHVNVDLLQLAAGPGLRLALEAASGLASLLFVGLIAYAGWFHFHEALVNGWTSESVWAVPLWIPLLPMPVGLGMLALQYVAELMRLAVDRPSGAKSPLADQNRLFTATTRSPSS